ncbi:MAG: putative substrate-binding transport protein, partial [Glaciihabitans sp.]|nr:putative substrate-binding transport protein [Glaciihabitans sp.]
HRGSGWPILTQPGGAHDHSDIAVAESCDVLRQLQHPPGIINLDQDNPLVVRTLDSHEGDAAGEQPGQELVEVLAAGEENDGVERHPLDEAERMAVVVDAAGQQELAGAEGVEHLAEAVHGGKGHRAVEGMADSFGHNNADDSASAVFEGTGDGIGAGVAEFRGGGEDTSAGFFRDGAGSAEGEGCRRGGDAGPGGDIGEGHGGTVTARLLTKRHRSVCSLIFRPRRALGAMFFTVSAATRAGSVLASVPSNVCHSFIIRTPLALTIETVRFRAPPSPKETHFVIDRRVIATFAGVATLAITLTGCATAAGSSSDSGDGTGKSLTVFISGDTNVQDLWESALIPAFEDANPGVTVNTTIDLHGEHDQQTLAKLTTSVKAGADPGYDLIDSGFISAAGKANLLADATEDTIPNLANVPETTLAAGDGFGIPYRASSVLLAYDTTSVTTPPATLTDLIQWIKDNPGKFAYNSPSTGGSGGAFVTTVLDQYVSDADREAMTVGYEPDLEAEWDEGFAELASLNPSVYQQGVYPNGNNQVLELLGTGEISMAPVWSDQIITAQGTGTIPDTVDYAQISDPSFTGSASYLGIPATSEHLELAQKLADFALSSDGQAIIAESISGYPVVDLETLPEEVATKFAAADPSALRPSYYSEMASDMANLWDQKVPGQ